MGQLAGTKELPLVAVGVTGVPLLPSPGLTLISRNQTGVCREGEKEKEEGEKESHFIPGYLNSSNSYKNRLHSFYYCKNDIATEKTRRNCKTRGSKHYYS